MYRNSAKSIGIGPGKCWFLRAQKPAVTNEIPSVNSNMGEIWEVVVSPNLGTKSASIWCCSCARCSTINCIGRCCEGFAG